VRKPYRAKEIFDCLARHLGVRYVDDVDPRSVPEAPSRTLHTEDLAGTPEELRADLEDAVISLDRQRVAVLVNRVSKRNAPLASVPAHLADLSAYTPVLDALEKCKRKFTEATA
jgi:hypothetical protein